MNATEPSQEPSLLELLDLAISARVAQIHTSIPATVLAYDPVTQKVQVQPAINGARMEATLGAPVPVIAQPIANIPVIWPSSGTVAGTQYAMTFPLPPGTPGQLIVSSRSTDEYKATAVVPTQPIDLRRHAIMDAWFMPGGRPEALTLPPTLYDPAAVVVGGPQVKLGDATATQAVALAWYRRKVEDSDHPIIRIFTPADERHNAVVGVVEIDPFKAHQTNP